MPSRPPGGSSRASQRPVADDPGAQQRRGLGVGRCRRAAGRRMPAGTTAYSAYPPSASQPVNVERRAQVLGAAPAPSAAARRCRAARPRPTRSPTREPVAPGAELVDHSPTTSWPGTTPGRLRRQVALGEVQVGTAHAAHAHLHQDLVRRRNRHWALHQSKQARPPEVAGDLPPAHARGHHCGYSGLAYALIPVSSSTQGSSPSTQASCPGSRSTTSPGPTVISLPSSNRTVI